MSLLNYIILSILNYIIGKIAKLLYVIKIFIIFTFFVTISFWLVFFYP